MSLYVLVAQYLVRRGRPKEALALQKKVVEIKEQTLVADHSARHAS